MDLREVVVTKRDGGTLSRRQIRAFLSAYVAGEAPDYLASALLATIYLRGMAEDELVEWTEAMLHSGDVLELAGVDRPLVDKHSTGGIGDKVSIPLAPAVAACGAGVPMVSGRGLGHTGGTLDKLEAIPGFRTDLDADRFRRALDEVGFAIGGQTSTLVPADRKLYALRDACGLVESLPLIASSILSKKLAEGIRGLVLDVKFGSGAFLSAPERGAELGATMLRIASRLGLAASAYQTCMDRPLGHAVGNALEIVESIACLRGDGPPDLRALVVLFGGEMLRHAGLAKSADEGERAIERALDSGAALECFERGIELQGGDPRVAHDPKLLPHAPDVDVVRAKSAGALRWKDARAVGRVVHVLGGARTRMEDAIDPAVGVVCLLEEGHEARSGDALFELHHRGGHGLDEARLALRSAYELVAPFERSPLVLRRLPD